MPNPCEKCGVTCWSGLGEYELCTRCMIGDQSPSIWALTKIKQDIVDFKENPRFPKKHRSAGCTLTYSAKTGECVGTEKPKDYRTYGDFVTLNVSACCDNKEGFPNTTIHFRKWLNAGQTSIGKEGPYKISSFDKLVEEGAPLFVATLFGLIKFSQEDLYVCAGCEKEFKNPPSGRYFAGTYCDTCWETYKKKNSRVCGKCRRPMYECFC